MGLQNLKRVVYLLINHLINDYLENGPNFIPPLFDVLTKFRSKPVPIVSDIEKAFLQISIAKNDRDALRFLWYKSGDTKSSEREVLHFRFRRLVFGLKSSPSTLGFVINEHLRKFENTKPNVVELLKSQLFVDDFVGSVDNVQEGFEVYKASKEIMKAGGFNLTKWKTSDQELQKLIENEENKTNMNKISIETQKSVQEDDESFVKTTLGSQTSVDTKDKSKILGLNWSIKTDEFYELINYAKNLQPTKRSVLRAFAH